MNAAPKPKNELTRVGGAGSGEPPSEAASLLSVIAKASTDPNVDVVKMRELMIMRKEIIAEEREQAFNEAMAAAQSEMRRIAADKDNSQTKSKYASYAALDRAIRPIYTKHGFSLSFDTDPLTVAESLDPAPAAKDYVRVVCYVSSCGHTRKYKIDMPADGKGAKGGDVMTKTHATGSAASYGRRYLVIMIFNLAIGVDDDDGNAAGGGLEYVTEAQAAELEKLIKDTGGDVAKFCAFAKVESLGQIYANRFDAAMAKIKEAGAARKAAGGKK